MMIVPNAVVAVAPEEAPPLRVEIAFPPSFFVVYREALFVVVVVVVVVIIFARNNCSSSEKSSEVSFFASETRERFGHTPPN